MATTKTIQSRQQQKYSTSTEWSNANPTLLQGEIAVVKIGNSYRFKVGDGTSKYNALPFVDEGALADKVDKYKTVFTGQGVYGFTGNGSTITEKQIFTDGQATNISGTIPLRTTNGNIIVPETPTNNTHAASKKYVDDAVAGAGGGSSFDTAYVPVVISATGWCAYKYLNENTVYVQFNIKNNTYSRNADGDFYVGKGLPYPAVYSNAYYAGNILCESAKQTTGTIDGMTTVAVGEGGYLVTPSLSAAIKDVYGSLIYPTNEKHYATYKITDYPLTELPEQTIQFKSNGTTYYGIRAISMGTDAYDVEYKTSSSGSSWTTVFDGTGMYWENSYLQILTFLAEPSSTLVTWMLEYGSKL